MQRPTHGDRAGLPAGLAAAGVVLGALGAIALLWGSARQDVGQRHLPAGRFVLHEPLREARDGGIVDVPGAPVSGPRTGRLAWSYQTGGRVSGRVASAADGRVYVASHAGRLHALEPDGTLRWQRELGAAAYGGPLLTGGRLYVGTDAGELLAFDTEGSLQFRAPMPAAVERPPALGPGGLVLCAAGRELLALDARDGAVVWRFAAHSKIFGAPRSDGQHIAFGAQDQRLYVLDAAGRLRAAVALGADVDAAPEIVAGDRVLASADDGRVHALTLDGEALWTAELGSPLRAPLALAGEQEVLVVSHGLRPALHLLDVRTGEVRARLPLGLSDSPQYFLRSGPVVGAGPVVYLGAPGPRVVAIDASGIELWSRPTGGHVHVTPTLAADGTLYVAADDGVLRAYRDMAR